MKNICILGGAGFIGHHLSNKLKSEGNYVRIVDSHDIRYPTKYDEYVRLDLRDYYQALQALSMKGKYAYNLPVFDEVYQLSADMGGMDFIENNEVECLTNNAQININLLKSAVTNKVKKYFYSSSVCIYPDLDHGVKPLKEEDAYPANPDNEYGWEKLYSERLTLAYAKRYPEIQFRVARFQNCYGEEGAYEGGREKAPAALCRKVAKAADPGTIEVYGDGTQVRAFIYVKDLIEAVVALTRSDIKTPTHIGVDEYLTIDDFAKKIIAISGKDLKIKHIAGPVGVKNRNFSNEKIYSTGWKPKYTLDEGLAITYKWILNQLVNK